MPAIKIPIELLNNDNVKVRVVRLNSGEITCQNNSLCPSLMIVEQGCLRVYKRSADGRMFTLYRVNPGECCSLTVSSILNNTMFPAIVEVEDDVLAYVVSAQHVRDWLRKDSQWQAYIFKQLTVKLTQLTQLMDNLAFDCMDSRIANLLCRRLGKSRVICTTHQCIADEVGTSREVVSRSLRTLECKGYIGLTRGRIEAVNFEDLKRFSTHH